MPVVKHNPESMYPQFQSYTHAVEISGNARIVSTSGLVGYSADGKTVPETFEEQGELIWQHLGAILASAGMTYTNLTSIRVYLTSAEYGIANTLLRKKYLGDHQVTSTAVVTQLLDPRWKMEMEATAVE